MYHARIKYHYHLPQPDVIIKPPPDTLTKPLMNPTQRPPPRRTMAATLLQPSPPHRNELSKLDTTTPPSSPTSSFCKYIFVPYIYIYSNFLL